MDGYSLCIQGGYACGGYHDVIFMGLGGKFSQKGGFAGTGFPGNEKMAAGAVDKALSHLEFLCLLHLHEQK